MNMVVSISLVIGSLVVLTSSVICRPNWIGDENKFLSNFVNHEFLNVLGVILAITLASLAQAHLSLNRIEERRGRRFLDNSRQEIKSSALWLIGLFCLGFVVVVIKPLLSEISTASAVFNASAVFILFCYILILTDVTLAVFSIKADVDG